MKSLKELKLEFQAHLNLGRNGHIYSYRDEETGIWMSKHTSRKEGTTVAYGLGEEEWDDLEAFKAEMIKRGVVSE